MSASPLDMPAPEKVVEDLRSADPKPALVKIDEFVRSKSPVDRARVYAHFGFSIVPKGRSGHPNMRRLGFELMRRGVRSSIRVATADQFFAVAAFQAGWKDDCAAMAKNYIDEEVPPTFETFTHLAACAPDDPSVLSLKERLAPAFEIAKENAGDRNYQAIVKAVLANGACAIAMQYPVIERTELEESFSDPEILAQKGKRFFVVDNQENFARELERFSFSDLFVDDFAGRFGHATARGNHLIAETAARAVQTALASGHCAN